MRKPWFRRGRRWEQWWAEETIRRYGLTRDQMKTLADYNGEVYRGIAHTPEWKAKMAELQAIYEESVERSYPFD